MKISNVNYKLLLPLLVSMLWSVAAVGVINCLLLKWLYGSYQPIIMLPLLLLLAEDAFVTGRTGLLIHYHARHTQAGLREFLVGNGAKQFEALLPYYRHVMTRTTVLSASRWLIAAVVTAFACCFILLFGGMTVMSALYMLAGVLLSMVICSMMTLLLSVVLYDKFNK